MKMEENCKYQKRSGTYETAYQSDVPGTWTDSCEKGKHFDGSQIEKGEVIAWSKDKYNLFRQQVKESL